MLKLNGKLNYMHARQYLFFVFFVSILWSCKRGTKTPQVEEGPYPLLEQQRGALLTKAYATPIRVLDSFQIMTDLEFLSSPACEGRRPGTVGHEMAQERLLVRMREAGVDSFENSMEQSFTGRLINGSTKGKNIVGWVKGTKNPEKFVVITAHYDHLGKAGDNATFFGADDNASGTACLLALAKYFAKRPQAHSLVFALLDREETGLEGAYEVVSKLETIVGLPNIVLNINMDMISRNDQNELFACGVWHNPNLRYLVDEVQPLTNVKLLMGHDTGTGSNNWTTMSDHNAFYARQIPFLYFGVEDHVDYHRATDSFDKINKSWYLENCNMIAKVIELIKE